MIQFVLQCSAGKASAVARSTRESDCKICDAGKYATLGSSVCKAVSYPLCSACEALMKQQNRDSENVTNVAEGIMLIFS
jgi:hypothetical protein